VVGLECMHPFKILVLELNYQGDDFEG
jgi:hypothetical protein